MKKKNSYNKADFQEYENLLDLINEHDQNVENWTIISFLTSLCKDSRGIKIILHILIAALKFPTESVGESQISVFQHHYGKRRSSLMEEHIFADYIFHLVDLPLGKGDLILVNALKQSIWWQKMAFYSNNKCCNEQFKSHPKVEKRET